MEETFPVCVPRRKAEPAPVTFRPTERRFALSYIGWSSLDRRATLPMLPWLVAEIRRRSEKGDCGPVMQPREVQLVLCPPFVRCVPSSSNNSSVFIFEHKAQLISRFIHNSNDLTYFAYLLRGQPDNPEAEMSCHVFKAADPNQVPEVITSIRQVSKSALKEDAKPKQEGDEAFYNSQKFEVLYCGKVTVGHKKAPSTLIDDCIDKFRQHEIERKRLRLLNGQRGSTENAPVEILMGAEGDPLSSALNESTEDPAAVEDLTTGGGKIHFMHLLVFFCVSQVGRFEVNLISPDSKTVVLEKNFKDISSCCQGIKQTDHFGFICRDQSEAGPSHYMCFVFQCASESLVDEVMLTLKQAFTTAAALQSNKTPIQLCEACPMHDLHKLCERIEGTSRELTKLAIQKYLSQLTDNEQAEIFERVQKLKPGSDHEENELVILQLRQLCETKQKSHLHIGEAPQVSASLSENHKDSTSSRFKLDILKNKARTSLTSSLENIFARVGQSRKEAVFFFSRFPLSLFNSLLLSYSTTSLFLQVYPRLCVLFIHPRQNTTTVLNGEGRKRTLSGCSSDSLSLPPTPRRVSWRQKIFLRVASPVNKPSHSDARELLPLSPRALDSALDPLGRLLPPAGDPLSKERPKKTAADYRALWKTAIHQQILLLRMEKENQRLEASRDELHIRKMKLNYQEVSQCSKDSQALWERKLTAPGRTTVPQDKEEMYRALCQGVPKSRRGEVWLLLSHQHRLHHRLPQRQQAPDTPYHDLLKQLTAQQHAILVDLGRTFPTHQYFSAQLGAGQLSLYNLLKAYSLLDTEVGYCQGISFLAGVLLLHMSEEQAFDMLKFLMYDLGIRRQFKPDMVSLQIQMYQLSRLLHDYHRDLYQHLEEHEISPSLYAAPWFLTLFASQFPLGFVSRIFDFVFAQGTEVIFKVALCLLSSHEGEIVECDSFESIVDYLKTTLPTLTQTQMEQTIAKVMEMDISKQLHAYEVEYHVLQDELLDAGPLPDDSDRLDRLEKTNTQLKKQNMDLLEKLQAARQKIQTLETSVDNFLSRESKMKHMIRSLEQERAAYQRTIERMRSCLPPDALTDVEMTQIKTGPNGKAKSAAKKP
uniref:TBC1 domain family member 4 n=1 Tax=Amphiprion ocellaris TaxID=80972 RepID=A0AAQ6A6Y7_AMPOC